MIDVINPEFIGGSLVFVMIGYVIALGFQVFMMYLNWKQSRVNNQMDDLIKEVKLLRADVKKLRPKIS